MKEPQLTSMMWDVVSFPRSEVKSQVDGVSVRVDRVERELEYLENKMPTQSDIEMEEALLEQQIKAAELDLLQKKAKIKVENGRKGGREEGREEGRRLSGWNWLWL